MLFRCCARQLTKSKISVASYVMDISTTVDLGSAHFGEM